MKRRDLVRHDGLNTSTKSKLLHGQKRLPKGSWADSIHAPK